jgi:hypothetical protein
MPGIRRGTPASQIARDYGVSLNEFATAVIDVVRDAGPPLTPDGEVARRREVCAAVSAAMLLAMDASALSDEERGRLEPLINEVLRPYWNRHCGIDAEAASYVTSRSTHYAARKVPGSQVKSAVNIVGALLEAIEVAETKRLALAERLVPAFAHRLVSDIYRINDVRARHGIELSVIATLCSLLQMTVSYDPLLRVMRID